jgi:subtilisin family serine protease
MSRNKISLAALVVIAILLIIALLAQCATPRPQNPTPTPELTPFPTPVAGSCPECLPEEETDIQPVQLEPGQSFIPDQFILIGVENDLQTVIEGLLEREPPIPVRREPLFSESFDYLDQYDTSQLEALAAESETPPLFTPEQLPFVQLNLYTLEPDSGVELGEVFKGIVEVVRPLRAENAIGTVLADLNYVMAFRVDGTPWGIGGAPYGIGGAPYGIGGAGEGEGGGLIASDIFMAQWALQSANGIGLYDDGELTTGFTGDGVRVGIFDTSPFTQTATYTMTEWMPEPALSVHASSDPVTVPVSSGTVDMSDHGFFAAGLIHAIAPDSEIHLIRVLNDQAEGDLHSLLRGINRFVELSLAANQARTGTASLEKTILNFSLTIRSDPNVGEGEDPLPTDAVDAIDELAGLMGVATEGSTALETPFQLIHELGGTIVAAAGNDSAEEPDSSPEPAGLPAAFSGVIGVEAANQAGERSCYSNMGGVRAPGGDGDVPLDGTPTPEAGGESAVCTPRHMTCDNTSPDCGYGVISTTYRVHEGFAYWVGTSFATPIVSGLVALQLDADVQPENIAGAIVLQNGIVNVRATLGQ